MRFYLSFLVFSILLVLFIILSPFQKAVYDNVNVLGAQAKLVNDARSYKIILFGDSMTSYLGKNAPEVLKDLTDYYPNAKISIQNYGFGSKNILFAKDTLYHDAQYLGVKYSSILGTEFNLIIIESFANNPLSEFGLEEGLKKQNQALDEIISQIQSKKPQSKIVFLATISPSKETFGQGSIDLTPQKRAEWVSERVLYLKNHIDYARTHNIPLINVYEKSLNSGGDGDTKYLNKGDNIHPSEEGILLISEEIADFISQNNLIDKKYQESY